MAKKKKKTAKPQPKSKPKSTKKAAKRPAKPAAKKPMKKVAKKPAPKPVAKAKSAPAAVLSKRKPTWLDETSHKPLIDRCARQLKSFMAAMADGQIDDSELAEQESRLIALMQEVEPQLPDALHPKVTQLLCELTAYDIMHLLHSINQNRPQTVFQG